MPVRQLAALLYRTYGSWGAGLRQRGPATRHLELADLEASEYDSGQSGLWTRGLLIRRNLADGACAYFTTWCPAGTGIETLVVVEGQRWSMEDSFETSKNELGLDHNGQAARDRLTGPGTAGTVMSRW